MKIKPNIDCCKCGKPIYIEEDRYMQLTVFDKGSIEEDHYVHARCCNTSRIGGLR